ncbi:hypothetical protein BKA70DRAFT_1252960 [Coprinopsis sp. MPI-PUGE-AT-0042]|nr:hypothetical protein BKA70DRAFT_1252960 [Coprinopsis sp. MPI-PUGE-AT-0042]
MQPPPPDPTPKLTALKSLLRQTLRITTQDGRRFLGSFAGTDKALNILLINTDEFRQAGGGASASEVDGPFGGMYESRFVGQVLVPWKVVVKIEVQKTQQEQQAAMGQQPSGSMFGYI